MTIAVELVYALAEASGVEPGELEYTVPDHIETDAIEALARHEAETWRLSFELPDQIVILTGGEKTTIECIPKVGLESQQLEAGAEILGLCPRCGEKFKRDSERHGYTLLEDEAELSVIQCERCSTEVSAPMIVRGSQSICPQ
ncbi:HalOD1 output domain-containing protein [Halovenus sp. HT40]|uniref:HalOD1 output domain-containing protein n=1 Tax=Halovenus sp. HT40 TaxID=3126691 RepID=UPI00300F649A